MKLTLLQTDIQWGQPSVNRLRAEAMLAEVEKSDVYLFPEMFTTGFAPRPEGLAEEDGATLSWMRDMARRYDAAIGGSVAVKAGGVYLNRFYFIMPDGSDVHYDKHHLFTYGGEHLRYERGEDRVEIEFRGVRFLLQVCYDLRFPVFSRNNGDVLYDVALYVASWPTSRMNVWETLLRARAIENQCYVAGVNRIGADKACLYSGGTMLVDAYGRTVAECPVDEESAITCFLDIEAQSAFREKFPVLADADRLRRW